MGRFQKLGLRKISIDGEAGRATEKENTRLETAGAHMCFQNGEILVRKPLCWETKANRKRRGWKRASCILIIKGSSRGGIQSEPGLGVKTRLKKLSSTTYSFQDQSFNLPKASGSSSVKWE